MNVDELLNVMTEMLDESTGLPFAGGKRVVDVDRMQDIIDEIRRNLPSEIRQAKAIVNDRADIVSGAKMEAEALVKRAEDRARILVGEQEIVKAAQQRAAEIVSAAQVQSREMRTTVTEYCEKMLHATEEQLVRSATEMKSVRTNLRKKAKAGN